MTEELPTAAFRRTPEDFVVDEIPLYPPSGAGEHLYVVLRKTGRATLDVLHELARALEMDPRGAGCAGMKDKRAVTTQALTLPFPLARDADAALSAARVDGVEIVSWTRHAAKLKPGHLAGNRFVITLRDVDAARAGGVVSALLAAGQRGVPNAFGPQRFGRDGDNPARAVAWLGGTGPGPREKREQRFLFSALQSLLFNRVLSRREAEGTWDKVLAGDLAKKADFEGAGARGVRHFGALFPVPLDGAELDDILKRAEAGAVVGTGPMFGAKMRWPEGVPAAIEREVLRDALGDAPQLDAFRHLGEGTRRPLVLPVSDLTAEIQPQADGRATIIARFVLPKGGYATTVLQRVCVLKEDRTAASAAAEERGGDADPAVDPLDGDA